MAGLHQPIRIQWNYTNHCNFDCEYCPTVLKSGSIPLPDPDVFSNALQLIHNSFNDFELTLIGGEPTAFSGVELALNQLKPNLNKKIFIETNASPSIDWWDYYGAHFSFVTINHHPDFLDINHILKVANILRSKQVATKIKFPIKPNNWDIVVENKRLLELSGYDCEIHLLYSNFTKGNNQYLEYSDQQMQFYYRDKNILESQIPTQIEFVRVNKLNQYAGHLCWAGVEQFVIDKFGNVLRGWCEQGYLGNIYDGTVSWPEDPIMCRREVCSNGFDLMARKSKNSWGRL